MLIVFLRFLSAATLVEAGKAAVSTPAVTVAPLSIFGCSALTLCWGGWAALTVAFLGFFSQKNGYVPDGQDSASFVGAVQIAVLTALWIVGVVVILRRGGGSQAGASCTDVATGISFEPHAKLAGKSLDLLGFGVRVKQLGPVAVNVYSVGLYSEAAKLGGGSLKPWRGKTAKELGKAPDFYSALAAAPQTKVLLLKFARGVGAAKVADALSAVPGVDKATLDEFQALLLGLLGANGAAKGDTLSLAWGGGKAEVVVSMRGAATGKVASKQLPAALFGMFLDKASVSPPLKTSIAARAEAELFA